MNICVFQTEKHDIYSNGDIYDDAQSSEAPIKHNHGSMSIIFKDSKSTPGSQKQLQIKLYTSVKNSLHQVNSMCVFK